MGNNKLRTLAQEVHRQMKKILMVTYDSPNIDRRIYLVADALQEVGYDVSILSPFADIEKGFEHIKVINLVDKNKRYAMLSTVFIKDKLKNILPIFIFKILKKIYRKIFTRDGFIQYLNSMTTRAISIKADYYIANDLPTLPIVKSCIDENGGRFIYDAHEFFLGQDMLKDNQKNNLEKVESSIFPYVDFFITVNEDIRKLFFDKYGDKKSEIIYNSTKCGTGEIKYLHDLIGINRAEKLLLYQGGFIERRKLENLIYISQYLNDCKLVMLGWGSSEKSLKKLAEKLGVINKKVFFIPKISQHDLIQYATSATIAIIPYDGYDLNTKYCTPNKLFEYICAELPIAYNANLLTVDKIISKNDFGFPIDIEDFQEVANEINRFVNDKKGLSLMKENIQKNKNIFSWDVEKQKIIKIFKSIDYVN